MKRQSGFTLIELIIVIVILGILAVTAAPQFFNFGGDARTSTVRGMEGSVKAAADLVYSRAAIRGVEQSDGARLNINGEAGTEADPNPGDIVIAYGYPAASSNGIIAALNADIGADADGTNDWYHDGGTAGVIRIRPRGQANDSECYVQYTAATGVNARAAVSTSVEGC